MKRASLTLQILMGVAVPFVLVTLLIGAIAYFSADDEISEVYDSQMISSAQQLWKLARTEEDPQRLQFSDNDMGLSHEDEAALDEYSSWRSFRVWRKGQLVMISDTAPSVTAPIGKSGFTTVRRKDDTWRVFTYRRPSDQIVVEVSERMQAREEISRRIVWGVSLPLLMVLPVIILAVWLGIRWGLRDLRGFAHQLRRRSPQDLRPMEADGLPTELAPLPESMNHLLNQLSLSREQERLFTDNAAHELRTPLAALIVQAEVARNAKSETERVRSLDALLGGARRAGRLLDQLLTLTRITHASAEIAPLNVHDIVRETLGDLYVKARVRRVDLILTGDKDAIITANPALLRILFGNLVDNAIKYTPNETRIEAHIARTDHCVRFSLRDHGPGITEAERDKVFGRFYRVKGNPHTGSGLGLAIVRTICDLLKAKISLETPSEGQGLRVELIFPIEDFSLRSA
jgi:signal transduction histidine kinase